MKNMQNIFAHSGTVSQLVDRLLRGSLYSHLLVGEISACGQKGKIRCPKIKQILKEIPLI